MLTTRSATRTEIAPRAVAVAVAVAAAVASMSDSRLVDVTAWPPAALLEAREAAGRGRGLFAADDIAAVLLCTARCPSSL